MVHQKPHKKKRKVAFTQWNQVPEEKVSTAVEQEEIPSSQDLEITVETLQKLAQSHELINSQNPLIKKIRKLLYELVDVKEQKTTLSNRISIALKEKRWTDAKYLLQQMRDKDQVPKLGCLQRWVRDCDAAVTASDYGDCLLVLDLILRATDPSSIGCATVGKDVPEIDPIVRYQCPCYIQGREIHAERTPSSRKLVITIDSEKYKPFFSTVYKEVGSERKPPNLHDMVLYTCPPLTAVPLYPPSEPVTRIDIPNLPRVFVLKNVLSTNECNSIVSACESMQFTPDTPLEDSASVLAHNFFWLADHELLSRVYDRCKDLLPPSINNQAIAGLNSRWRIYRYQPGSIYRPHIDGAWPGSAVTKDGEYQYDGFGDRWSKLTFLIRLNEEFNGGATTFFTPSIHEGHLDARQIHPQMGDVLVFPHGDAKGSFLHEGSPVLDSQGEFIDCKYVIRTEVLYMLPSKSN